MLLKYFTGMSSLGNGRFDIPDYDQLEDESFPPLPPPHSPGQGGDLQDPFGNDEGNLTMALLHVNSSYSPICQPKTDFIVWWSAVE